MKGYYLVELEISPPEWETLQGILDVEGYLGSEITEGEKVLVRAYYQTKSAIPKEVLKLSNQVLFVEERNWNEEWKKFFKPIPLSDRFAVIPSWMSPILIHPGRTFGTGTHETTKLAVRFLEKVVKEGTSLLDLGAGSGILSIVAKKLGAKRVVACDIQEECKEEIPLNCKLNGISGVEVYIGDFRNLKETFDVVVANIEKHLLSPLVPGIYEKVREYAVFSGILTSQVDEFSNLLKKVGFKVLTKEEEKEWAAFLCRK